MGGVIHSPNGQSSLDLGTVKAGCGIKLKVLLNNSGPRAAFVHATCCKPESSTPLLDSHAHLIPSRVVVAAHSTQELLLYYRPDQHEEQKCRVSNNPLALLRIQSGDELMRQHLVRANEEEEGEGGRKGKVLDKLFLTGFSQQKKAPSASSGKY